MQDEDRREEEGGKGEIEEGKGQGGARKLAHSFQVVKRGGGLLANALRGGHGGAEDASVEVCLQGGTDAGADAAADGFQEGHRGEQPDDEEEKGDECRYGPAGKDPVVDLQHEERAGQHQKVHEDAEKRNEEKRGDVPGGGSGQGFRHEVVRIQTRFSVAAFMARAAILCHGDHGGRKAIRRLSHDGTERGVSGIKGLGGALTMWQGMTYWGGSLLHRKDGATRYNEARLFAQRKLPRIVHRDCLMG